MPVATFWLISVALHVSFLRSHSKTMPFLCKICKRRFKTKTNLRIHVTNHAVQRSNASAGEPHDGDAGEPHDAQREDRISSVSRYQAVRSLGKKSG